MKQNDLRYLIPTFTELFERGNIIELSIRLKIYVFISKTFTITFFLEVIF